MIKDKKSFHCNVELTLDLIGGKWKTLIMHHLVREGTMRFGQFKRKIPSINERVLSRQLRELEERHLIHRKDYDEVPPRVEYSLTDMGIQLSPIITDLAEWGEEYNAKYNYAEVEHSQ